MATLVPQETSGPANVAATDLGTSVSSSRSGPPIILRPASCQGGMSIG